MFGAGCNHKARFSCVWLGYKRYVYMLLTTSNSDLDCKAGKEGC